MDLLGRFRDTIPDTLSNGTFRGRFLVCDIMNSRAGLALLFLLYALRLVFLHSPSLFSPLPLFIHSWDTRFSNEEQPHALGFSSWGSRARCSLSSPSHHKLCWLTPRIDIRTPLLYTRVKSRLFTSQNTSLPNKPT